MKRAENGAAEFTCGSSFFDAVAVLNFFADAFDRAFVGCRRRHSAKCGLVFCDDVGRA